MHEESNDHDLFSFEELGKAFARALEGQAETPAEPAHAVTEEEILEIPDEFLGDGFGESSETPPAEDAESFRGGEASVFGDATEDDGVVPVTPLTVLEAMLFVGDPRNRSLDPRTAAELMRGVTVEEVHALVRELNEKYAAQRAPWMIEFRDEGYAMRLREEFLPIREVFYGKIRQAKLSQEAIDTLAIIAYKQPLTAEEITRLRGTAGSAILSQLVRRQLLQTKRVKRDGKMMMEYTTTERFLELFTLESLGDLPRSEDLDRK